MRMVLLASLFGSLAIGVLTVLSCRPPMTTSEVKPVGAISPDTAISSSPRTLYGRKLRYYAQVDKAGDYFRRMLIDSASAEVYRQTGTLPEGTLLVMETWFGADQSTVYARQKVAGEWHSTSFSAASPDYRVMLTTSCNNCQGTPHKRCVHATPAQKIIESEYRPDHCLRPAFLHAL